MDPYYPEELDHLTPEDLERLEQQQRTPLITRSNAVFYGVMQHIERSLALMTDEDLGVLRRRVIQLVSEEHRYRDTGSRYLQEDLDVALIFSNPALRLDVQPLPLGEVQA